MRELFIADLDGTLMDPVPAITDFTREALASLEARGMLFSVATARTAATAGKLLAGVDLSVPAILMNGACIWDKENGAYVKTEPYPISLLLPTLRRFGVTGFAYAISDDALITSYERIGNDFLGEFMDERIRNFDKSFTHVSDLAQCGDIVYFSTTDRQETLEPVARALQDIDRIRVEFYDDVYHKGNSFLEVSSRTASKALALRYLRKRYGFDRVTAFGDNINDIALFEAADKRLAVANARPELKAAADEVIGPNTADGVARYLLENFGAGR